MLSLASRIEMFLSVCLSNRSELSYSLRCGRNAVMSIFVDKAFENKALIHAARFGNIDIVNLLLDNGADVNTEDGYPLRWAAMNGHTEIVRILIKYGADVNVEKGISLRWAATRGHAKIVRLLLNAGAVYNSSISKCKLIPEIAAIFVARFSVMDSAATKIQRWVGPILHRSGSLLWNKKISSLFDSLSIEWFRKSTICSTFVTLLNFLVL